MKENDVTQPSGSSGLLTQPLSRNHVMSSNQLAPRVSR
jgi:hypothetical protein